MFSDQIKALSPSPHPSPSGERENVRRRVVPSHGPGLRRPSRHRARPSSGEASQVVARIGAVEGFVAEREIRHDVVLDRRLEQRPLQPRRIARVAAIDAAVRREPQPNEHVAAKAFDQRRALARGCGTRPPRQNRSECGPEYANISE